uniref:Secreted protein n=1 Tax=Schizaphis graminum TaxID=13262 RepID=A0A2S2PJU2_SCHGA
MFRYPSGVCHCVSLVLSFFCLAVAVTSRKMTIKTEITPLELLSPFKRKIAGYQIGSPSRHTTYLFAVSSHCISIIIYLYCDLASAYPIYYYISALEERPFSL